MDTKLFSMVQPETYGLNKTEDITANRLLALFVDSNDAFFNEFENSKAVQFVRFVAELVQSKGDLDFCDDIGNLPLAVVDTFLKFLAESPHIHVIID